MWVPAIKFSVQILSGKWQGNTPPLSGIIKQIIIKSENSDNSFDFVVLDDFDIEVLRREVLNGEINELIEFPVAGIYTLRIENATIDEGVKIKLMEAR